MTSVRAKVAKAIDRVIESDTIAFAAVEAHAGGQMILERSYAARVVVAAEGQVVCERARVFVRSQDRNSGKAVYDWRPYLAVIRRKPGALRNGEGSRRPAATLSRRRSTPRCLRQRVRRPPDDRWQGRRRHFSG